MRNLELTLARPWPGQPFPLGATWNGLGVNFALYSDNAEAVELLLFDRPDSRKAANSIFLHQRTGPVWHVFIPNLHPGQLYGYRVYGPHAPEAGHRFNPHKVLLDPYAKAIGRPLTWHDSLFGYHFGDPLEDLSFNELDSAPYAPLGMVVEDAFEWGDDKHLRIPWEDTIIYETHVKDISMLHPEVDLPLRGTYLGLASEPVIEHLTRLGVTTVELLPVQSYVNDRHLVDKGLTNHWGYNPLCYFAPEPDYAAEGPESAVREFKMMVRRLHAAGLEVIIDVVYNHTGEGNHFGPTLSFKGIDNASYYKSSPQSARYYMDYTGTGNTLDAGNSYVLQLMTDSLRYWVTEMHVDGFRFDLAATLTRELHDINLLSAFFKILQQDPVLSRVKLIAEPWDVGPGGYLVGNFPWYWAEWNGRYRDTVRRYWRGERVTDDFASRLSGSGDLYARSGRRPFASVNFVTAHDGFTLEDLVSYNHKHNEANLEGNRDGEEHNDSYNCGVEGETEIIGVLTCRENRKRALLATLLVSQGIPMILGGDELSHTKRGNNNTYAQDNDFNYYDWNLDERRSRFLDFVRTAVTFRKMHPTFRRYSFATGEVGSGGFKDLSWWRPDGHEMRSEDWGRLQAFGMMLSGGDIGEVDPRGNPRVDDSFLLLFNNGKAKRFIMPPAPDHEVWERLWSGSSEAIPGRQRYTGGSGLILKSNLMMVFRAVHPR